MTNISSTSDTELLIGYLKGNTHIRENERERIIAACELTIASLRTPIETARKHAFLTLDQAVIQTAIRLNLFVLLSTGCTSGKDTITTDELAANTTPPSLPIFLTRFLRYLAKPLNLVLEQGPGNWSISESGRTLASKGYTAGCNLYFDSCGPAFRALPLWMTMSPTDGVTLTPATPFKAAVPHSKGGFFDWLQEDPVGLQDFHTWMRTLADQQYDCQQKVEFGEWIPTSITSDETAFVDVGGGSGAQCTTLRRTCGPSMQGRIVNQDRAEVATVDGSKLDRDRIQTMAHDFFTEQPVKGARIYHFRQILHDWPDAHCVKILQLTRDAMTAQSTLLIDEVVMPEQGAHWMVTQRDLTMLALFNAGERTEKQWRSLLKEAGLELQEIRTYDTRMSASLLVAQLP